MRKNAVFAVASIFQHSEALIPDAPELIETFLETEYEHACKRNAFVALQMISHEKALNYLSKVFDGIPNANDLLQLAELEFIRKDAVQNQQNKVLLHLLQLHLTRLTCTGALSKTYLRPPRSISTNCRI